MPRHIALHPPSSFALPPPRPQYPLNYPLCCGYEVKETAKLAEDPTSPKSQIHKVSVGEAIQEWKYLSKLIGTVNTHRSALLTPTPPHC